MNILGIKIKEFRSLREWTQNELAKRSGVDRGHLASIETGKVANPSADTFLKLARAFKIRPEELYQAAGYVKEAKPLYPRQESPEDILDRFKIVMPFTVPVYEDFPFHAGESVEPVDYTPVAKNRVGGRKLEAYIAHGKCLEPDIQDGDIIIVDRDGQINVNMIVAALFHEMLHLGRLRKIADELYLENNDGRIKLEEAQVAAPVIEVRRSLK